MNKARRKALSILSTEAAELVAKLTDIQSQLETLRDEEQEYFDAMPEAFQQGDKGQMAEAAITAMEEAMEVIECTFDLATQIDAATE